MKLCSNIKAIRFQLWSCLLGICVFGFWIQCSQHLLYCKTYLLKEKENLSFQSIAMVLKLLWIQTLLCKYWVIVFYLCREPSTFNVCSAAAAQPRTRRFSASCSLYSSGLPSPRLTPRVSQLRQEECIDVMYREAAHERELNSTMVMSQSWEDLRLVGDTPNKVINWLNY